MPEARLSKKERPPISSVEVCFNAWDDNGNTLIDEGCGVRQGQVQVMVAWANVEGDVDLHVRDPQGEIASSVNPTHTGLSHSQDCLSAGEDCGKHNFENVYLEESAAEPGKYQVRIRLERMPVEELSLTANLGLRLPSGTRSYGLEFFAEGQEILLDFEVAPSEDKEMVRASRRE